MSPHFTTWHERRAFRFVTSRMLVRLARTGAAVVAAVLVTGCGSSAPDAPNATSTIAIKLVTGDRQSGTVAHQLPQALTVRLEDASTGQAMVSRDVEFSVRSGRGTLLTVFSKTNARGEASTFWTLGRTASDSQRVEARSADPATGPQSSVFFTAVGRPDAAFKVGSSGGNAQTGVPGEFLPDSIFAVVVDQHGNPISGLMARWQVLDGGGKVAPDSQLTDGNGRTAVRWRMGSGFPFSVLRVRFAGQDTLAQGLFIARTGSPFDPQVLVGESQRP